MSGEYHKPDRVIIDDPALHNLDLEAFGIVTAVPAQPAASNPLSIDDLRRAIELVERTYQPPIPARIEVDYLALFALRRAVPAAESPPDPIARLTGLPIVVKGDLPLGGWRAIDTAGNVMREGTVTP